MTKSQAKPAVAAVNELFSKSPDGLREIVRAVMQEMLEAEMTDALAAGRGAHRQSARIPFRLLTRMLVTRVGKLELRVLQDRDGRFSTELFERYQRSEQALVATLAEMYDQGVSTRDWGLHTRGSRSAGDRESRRQGSVRREDLELPCRTRSFAEFDGDAVAGAIPASLQSLLTAPVDRLAPKDQSLLQAASVIGRRFNAELLAAVADNAGDIEARFAGMRRLDLIRSEGASQEYAFKHASVRDAFIRAC